MFITSLESNFSIFAHFPALALIWSLNLSSCRKTSLSTVVLCVVICYDNNCVHDLKTNSKNNYKYFKISLLQYIIIA